MTSLPVERRPRSLALPHLDLEKPVNPYDVAKSATKYFAKNQKIAEDRLQKNGMNDITMPNLSLQESLQRIYNSEVQVRLDLLISFLYDESIAAIDTAVNTIIPDSSTFERALGAVEAIRHDLEADVVKRVFHVNDTTKSLIEERKADVANISEKDTQAHSSILSAIDLHVEEMFEMLCHRWGRPTDQELLGLIDEAEMLTQQIVNEKSAFSEPVKHTIEKFENDVLQRLTDAVYLELGFAESRKKVSIEVLYEDVFFAEEASAHGVCAAPQATVVAELKKFQAMLEIDWTKFSKPTNDKQKNHILLKITDTANTIRDMRTKLLPLTISGNVCDRNDLNFEKKMAQEKSEILPPPIMPSGIDYYHRWYNTENPYTNLGIESGIAIGKSLYISHKLSEKKIATSQADQKKLRPGNVVDKQDLSALLAFIGETPKPTSTSVKKSKKHKPKHVSKKSQALEKSVQDETKTNSESIANSTNESALPINSDVTHPLQSNVDDDGTPWQQVTYKRRKSTTALRRPHHFSSLFSNAIKNAQRLATHDRASFLSQNLEQPNITSLRDECDFLKKKFERTPKSDKITQTQITGEIVHLIARLQNSQDASLSHAIFNPQLEAGKLTESLKDLIHILGKNLLLLFPPPYREQKKSSSIKLPVQAYKSMTKRRIRIATASIDALHAMATPGKDDLQKIRTILEKLERKGLEVRDPDLTGWAHIQLQAFEEWAAKQQTFHTVALNNDASAWADTLQKIRQQSEALLSSELPLGETSVKDLLSLISDTQSLCDPGYPIPQDAIATLTNILDRTYSKLGEQIYELDPNLASTVQDESMDMLPPEHAVLMRNRMNDLMNEVRVFYEDAYADYGHHKTMMDHFTELKRLGFLSYDTYVIGWSYFQIMKLELWKPSALQRFLAIPISDLSTVDNTYTSIREDVVRHPIRKLLDKTTLFDALELLEGLAPSRSTVAALHLDESSLERLKAAYDASNPMQSLAIT